MPIKDLQRQATQSGQIRFGTSEDTGRKDKNNNPIRRPVRSDTLVLSSPSRFYIGGVADLLGGDPHPWTHELGAPAAGLWRVITEATEVTVTVPAGPKAIDTWYEMWQPKMCVRRCDGETEQKSQHPCLCPADLDVRAKDAGFGKACKMTTRVNMSIPDAPGVGVWLFTSHGYYAASELSATAEDLANASEQGLRIPAIFRMGWRERRIYTGPNSKPEHKKFQVPVLDVIPSEREIVAAAQGQHRLALPPPMAPARAAIGAGTSAPAGLALAERAEVTPQDIAFAAVCAKTQSEILELGNRARERDWLDESVEEIPGSEIFEPLRELLNARHKMLGGAR